MKKIFLIIGALLAALVANAQQPWTLQQCVDTALANNRNIKQKALLRKTNEISYQQARLNLLPDLNASVNQNFNFGRTLDSNNDYQAVNSSTSTFGIGSQITLFDGLRMKYNIDARMADLKASDAELEKIQRDIVMSVSSSFLQVLLNKELLQIAVEQLKVTETNIEQKKQLVAAGKLAEGEMFELYAQQSKEEFDRTQAENTLKLSLLDLAQILELADFEKLDVAVPADLMLNELQLLNPESVFQSALINRPEVKSAEYKLDGSKTNVDIARSYLYPSLGFGAQMGTGYYNLKGIPNASFKQQIYEQFNTVLGFSLNIPIFNKFETKNSVKKAQIDVESNKLNVDNVKLELRKTVQQAYYNAVAAKAKWEAAQKSETASNEAYRFANQKYEGGRATVYALLHHQARGHGAGLEYVPHGAGAAWWRIALSQQYSARDGIYLQPSRAKRLRDLS